MNFLTAGFFQPKKNRCFCCSASRLWAQIVPRFAETWRIVVGEAYLDIEKEISIRMGIHLATRTTSAAWSRMSNTSATWRALHSPTGRRPKETWNVVEIVSHQAKLGTAKGLSGGGSSEEANGYLSWTTCWSGERDPMLSRGGHEPGDLEPTPSTKSSMRKNLGGASFLCWWSEVLDGPGEEWCCHHLQWAIEGYGWLEQLARGELKDRMTPQVNFFQ